MASNIHSHQRLMGPALVTLIVYAAAHLPPTATNHVTKLVLCFSSIAQIFTARRYAVAQCVVDKTVDFLKPQMHQNQLL